MVGLEVRTINSHSLGVYQSKVPLSAGIKLSTNKWILESGNFRDLEVESEALKTIQSSLLILQRRDLKP